MLTTPNDVITFALRASHNRFRRFLEDLKPTEFSFQPIAGANSIAWMLGHLTLVDRRILGFFGVEGPALPVGFADRFQTTGKPAEGQSGLGDPAELLALFDAHRTLLIETVERADAATLNKPLEKPHPLFSTVGEAAAFMAVHLGLHSGQVSMIRRSLGYPPVV
jgi:uncharacterized damage-inducible protein DinB